MKRLFDIFFASLGLLFLLPFLVLIGIIISLESGFPIFFLQKRIGKNMKPFRLIKFRTMQKDSEKAGKLTIGNKDSRITRVGFFLRKYKLDELPQLMNVLIGNMSIVGPRPEVENFVNLYTEDQKAIFKIRPGITDRASIQFRNESEILKASKDPEKLYISEIMPKKLSINLEYLEDRSLFKDVRIIFKTFKAIILE